MVDIVSKPQTRWTRRFLTLFIEELVVPVELYQMDEFVQVSYPNTMQCNATTDTPDGEMEREERRRRRLNKDISTGDQVTPPPSPQAMASHVYQSHLPLSVLIETMQQTAILIRSPADP
jgi:hypothetical protein